MQRERNMAGIVKFLCIMVIFLPLFLDASNFDPEIRCSKNDDCPKVSCLYPLKPICQFTKCRCVKSARGPFSMPT
uniref:Nodule-specific cysteine-rich peptide G06 n=1 Tax=Pisum sativum TaxID=3888 RepID=A0A7T8IFZ2_PEA|nr:nodule-specific cysteine-rich peptide G06 [Pisum sativum]